MKLRPATSSMVSDRALRRVITGVAFLAIVLVGLVLAFLVKESVPLLTSSKLDLAALLWPRQWAGYDAPEAVWQPVGSPPKLNLVPLFVGTIKTTVLAILTAAPIAVLAAIYTTVWAPPRLREIVKPTVEVLASVPSVVVGFFALTVLANASHAIGLNFRLNALVAGIGLAIAIAPVIYTLSEDALSAVPSMLPEGATALGAREWQVVTRVLVPAALPGILSAVLLGVGRAIGETMIVLMASGNAAVIALFDPTSSARTITATIAAELGEVPRGSDHFRVLFLLGLVLFMASLGLQTVGAHIVRRLVARRGETT
jgi:phosphate transport system permease protein